MSVNSQDELLVAQTLASCMPEFSHVNHYWDKKRACVVAKILPGEFYMTKDDIMVATTLGSCVATCIWDKTLGIGGMNHFMLPLSDKEAHEVNWGQRGLASDATRYGNFAMEHLINLILKNGGRRINLRAKLFGGGKVLKQMSDVGQKNIDFALHYLTQENILLESSDLGANFPRKVLFHPKTGKAFVKKLNSLPNDTIVKREFNYRNSIAKEPTDGDIELF